VSRSGRSSRSILVWPLLLALITFGAAAAVSPYETAWRASRQAMDRGDIAGALKIVEDALVKAGKDDSELVWRLRVWRATLLITTGKEARAFVAQPLPAHVRNTEAGARHLFAQYMLSRYNGAADPALLKKARDVAAAHARNVLPEILMIENEAGAREAARLARQLNDEALVAKAEANLVFLYGRARRYTEAIEIGEPLLPKLKRLQLLRAAKDTIGNLAWIYSEVGNYEQAAELLAVAIAESIRMKDDAHLFNWLSVLNNVHATRRDWNSMIRDSSVVLRGSSKDMQSRAWAFSSLARAHLELGNVAEARAAVRQALAIERGPSALVTRIVDARIEMQARNYEGAAKTLSDVLRAKPQPHTELEALGQLTRLHALTKRPNEAQKTFRQAVGIVEKARTSVGIGERLSAYNSASELFDNYIDFLIQTNRPLDALRVTETSRAQTLAEGLDLPAATLDPRAIAKRRNATILCYWLGRNRSYVWTITPANVTLTPIAQNDTAIEKTVETYRARLVTTEGTLDRSKTWGTQLFTTLIPAAVRNARGARIIVIPDGKLHTLNFETLIVPDKQPRYWIEDAVISNASSLQLLTRGAKANGNAPHAPRRQSAQSRRRLPAASESGRGDQAHSQPIRSARESAGRGKRHAGRVL
jgi:tetratricopeptide (TPR) repeat protein